MLSQIMHLITILSTNRIDEVTENSFNDWIQNSEMMFASESIDKRSASFDLIWTFLND